jgi:hypothetical protein
MNELIEIANKIHITLSDILIKYQKGILLNEIEDDILSELYIQSEEGNIKSIDEINFLENKYIKQLTMGTKNATKHSNTGSVKKINLKTEVKNLSGETFTSGEEAYFEIKNLIDNKASLEFIRSYCEKKSNDKKLTVKAVIKTGILNNEPEKLTANEKFDMYKLAMKIESEEGEFTTSEKETIKKAVGKVWGIEVTGFVWNFIDEL